MFLRLYILLFIKYFKYLFPAYKEMKTGDFGIRNFKSILPKNPVILEVGANNGSTTREFLDMFPTGRIFCVEPDQRAITDFKKHNFPKQVTLFQGALSYKNGNQTLYLSDKKNDLWTLSSSLSVPRAHKIMHPTISFGLKEQVKTLRLDTFLEQNDLTEVDLLWMDVQGLEYEILSCNTRILEKFNYIYLEYSILKLYENSRKLKEFKKLLGNHKIYMLFQNDVLFKRI
jgi:FkbM family methyltransferase